MKGKITRIKCDNIILADKVIAGYVYLDGESITEVSGNEKPADITYDFSDKYLAPAFIDAHTHGSGGYAFADTSAQEVINGCDFHLAHGTVTVAPTISAERIEVVERSVKNISQAKRSGKAKGHIIGAHLEGPYLSAKQCGAQCPTFITPPVEADYKRIVKEYGEDVTRWTYAPENDEDGAFAKYLTEHGVIASAGHTDATYDDMKLAIDSGCNLITHLYSCTSTVTRNAGFRSLGVIESAYLRDELTAEIIADGKHLPPDLVKMIVKIKGTDKVIAVTDSMPVAGVDITEGECCGTKFIVEEGVARLPDRSAFAGSIATGDRLLKILVAECGFSYPDALKMLALNAARMHKLNKGEIKPGLDADLIAIDTGFCITDVFVMGEKVI